MFTGIIEDVGTVKTLRRQGNVVKLQVSAPMIAAAIQPGQSICVNGVCLTVIEKDKDKLSFEVMPETIRCTNLGLLRQTDKVNLERALKADGRLDGHLLSGHIDATGIISRRQTKGGDVIITVRAQADLLRYIALKGSVALDGVSLTVSALENTFFSVSLIPYTLKNTTLASKKPKDIVNVECDMLAKYIEKFAHQNMRSNSPINLSFLQAHGFSA